MKQIIRTVLPIWQYLTAVLIVIFIVVFGWRDEQRTREQFLRVQCAREPFGVLFNPERRRQNMVPIPDGWYTRETSVFPVGAFRFGRTLPRYWKTQTWQPDGIAAAVAHVEKIVQADMGSTDSLIQETDRFQNRADEAVAYDLITRYNYGLSTWSCELTTFYGDTSSTKVLSKAQSDSVLRRWGLTR
jgi:hypothetical protein